MIEIERKYLVVNDNYKSGKAQRISQGYICSENDRVVRVRIKGDKAYLTIKNATIGFARNEYEYEIPVADAEAMLHNTCQQPIIDKTRYIIKHKGHTWEIDEFHGDNEGLVIAEIELENKTNNSNFLTSSEKKLLAMRATTTPVYSKILIKCGNSSHKKTK